MGHQSKTTEFLSNFRGDPISTHGSMEISETKIEV